MRIASLTLQFRRGADELDTRERIAEIDCAVLLLHGTNDIMVPMRHSLELSAHLREHGCVHTFVPLSGGGHLDSILHPSLLAALVEFFEGAAASRSVAASHQDASPATPCQLSCNMPPTTVAGMHSTPRVGAVGAPGTLGIERVRVEQATPAWLRQAATILPSEGELPSRSE